ncbi:DUF4377 domain-containing protein [Myroides guanonis]|nr:DUF4377 domain-containing protein [Myroides guanonis]
MKNLYLVFVTSLSILSSQAQEIKRMFVKENTVSCVGVAPMQCLQIKYEDQNQWSNFYSNIKGFDYEPGYRYELMVKETAIPLNQVPADASSINYELEALISKVKTESAQQSILDYITKNNWKLIQMNGKNDRDYQQSIRLNFDTFKISGNAGCNGFGGSYAYNADEQIIAFPNFFHTEMACNNLDLENEFFNTIQNKVFRFDVADQTLNFYQNDRLVLMFGVSN